MGCNISRHNYDYQRIANAQIAEIKNGTISPLSFQIFLNSFYFFSRYKLFYTELPLEKHLLILDSIGPLSKSECTTYLKNFCLYFFNDKEELCQSLRLISQKMLCKTLDKTNDSDVYLPIGFDKDLFKSIMLKKFTTPNYKIRVTKEMTNWSNTEILNDRNIFINEKQNQIPHIQHSKDLSLLIQNNDIDNLWREKNINLENNVTDEHVSKPLNWQMNIHSAASEGKKSSIKYSLSLLPQIINLQDRSGGAMVHYAAKKNQKKILIYLHEMGADFNIYDGYGNLPIHHISKSSLIYTMLILDIDLNARNKKGLSLIDIRMEKLDKKMIKTLIQFGVNIFEPNPKGAYFMQTAMQDDTKKCFIQVYHMKEFIAKVVSENRYNAWYENPIIREFMDCTDKDGKIPKEKMDLLQAIKNQDIPRIKVILAYGAEPDNKMPEVVTNLYYCAQNGLTEIAQILLDNYCNPNKIDKNRHNTFWIAAMNEHFETASLIHKYGVKLNVVDSNGETLLHCAYRLKKNDVLKFVLTKGANPNIKNKKGQSLTFLAFQTRDDEVAELLQNKCKGNINTKDENKNSLAHLAILQGDLDRIDYLYKHHINMNLKNNKGHTVLMVAFLKGADISTMEFLAQRGSNFNSVDNQKNNLLHYLMNSKNPSEEVFNYLINKNIDFSLENSLGQFPISIAIKNHHDKLGFKLLEMGCAIHDKSSEHEPIVEALNRNNTKWFEALVNYGADALNEKVGVISRYIESDFYNYNIFKKITKMNIFIESPFQTALYNEYYKCAADIWNFAISKNIDGKLASNKDCYNRIPLSVVIMIKNDNFVKALLRKCYDCSSPDEDGRTPFIHACIVDNIDWMNDLFDILPVSNLNLTDKYKCSGLTYAANNKRKKFCDLLFINNIEVFECKIDKNGIIRNYQNLMNRYEKAKSCAERNLKIAHNRLNDALHESDDIRRRKDALDDDINAYNRNCRCFNNRSEYDAYEDEKLKREKARIDVEMKSLATQEAENNDRYKAADKAYDYYLYREENVSNATRKDILNRLSYLEELAIHDKYF